MCWPACSATRPAIGTTPSRSWWPSRRCATRAPAWAKARATGARVRAKRQQQAEDLANLVQARQVADPTEHIILVGDFNDWDASSTPMRAARAGVWTAVLPLAPGRYRYAFLVNGTEWIADPAAPRAPDDEFGAPGSVVTVGGS